MAGMSDHQSPDWRPRKSPDLWLKILDDEAIILDRSTDRVHQLNEVATFMLECCDGTRSQDDIVVAVVKRYSVDKQTATRDASELLTSLRQLGIVV